MLNRRIVLASRPDGEAVPDNFRLETVTVPELEPGQVLVRHRFVSVDPYMRGRMNDSRSYAVPQPLGVAMRSSAAGEIVRSRHDDFAVGEAVVTMGGWQEYGVVGGADLATVRRVDACAAPLSTHLGALGLSGVTAWIGLKTICVPEAGETVVIGAASGAVGGVAGVLARAMGCRVVGIAGGPSKCAYAVDELGFDDCLDHKRLVDPADLAVALRRACPDGVDAYFENVGGRITDAVMQCMNPFSRMAVCGMIAGYDGAPLTMADPGLVLTRRMTLRGFIVGEEKAHWPAAFQELRALYGAGGLRLRESVSDGLETAPAALLGLLRGRNFGKQLVRVGAA